MIGVPGVEFESDKFNWLVAANTGDVLTCIANTAAEVRTLDDAVKRKTPLIVAATGPGSFTTSSAKAYKDILRANFKIVTGYPGQAGILNALQRGEADAGCFTWSAVKAAAKDMLDTKAAVVFTQTGVKELRTCRTLKMVWIAPRRRWTGKFLWPFSRRSRWAGLTRRLRVFPGTEWDS